MYAYIYIYIYIYICIYIYRYISACGEGRLESGRKYLISSCFRKVDVRLPGKENSNAHGARPVHLISEVWGLGVGVQLFVLFWGLEITVEYSGFGVWGLGFGA